VSFCVHTAAVNSWQQKAPNVPTSNMAFDLSEMTAQEMSQMTE